MCGKCEIQIILETKLPMVHPFTGCSVLQKEPFQTEEKSFLNSCSNSVNFVIGLCQRAHLVEKKTDHCPTAVMIPGNE